MICGFFFAKNANFIKIFLHNLGEIWGLGMSQPLFAWGATTGNEGDSKNRQAPGKVEEPFFVGKVRILRKYRLEKCKY